VAALTASAPAGATARSRVFGVLAATILAAMPGACVLLEPPPASPEPLPTALVSGVTGRVVVGTRCSPAASPGSACFEPYQARLVLLDEEGEVVLELLSDPDGRFEAQLPPGTYTIVPAPGGDPYPAAAILTLTVLDGQMSDVEVRYDSGLGDDG
jgi:hypothetical protein